jgi:hypothetical protein
MNLTEEQNIDIQIPPIATKETPVMYQDTDSVSTFHPVTPSDNSKKHNPLPSSTRG